MCRQHLATWRTGGALALQGVRSSRAGAPPARRAKLVTMLDLLGQVRSFEQDPGEQYRLVAGWSCTNLAQAAAIIDYHAPDFVRFLTQVCYPLLD